MSVRQVGAVPKAPIRQPITVLPSPPPWLIATLRPRPIWEFVLKTAREFSRHLRNPEEREEEVILAANHSFGGRGSKKGAAPYG